MNTPISIKKAKDICIAHIAKQQQQQDGSFVAQIHTKETVTTKTIKPLFPTALILNALQKGRHEKAIHAIAKKGLDFLLKERNSDWSWNYWPQKIQKQRKHILPNDLDDTCMSLIALTLYKHESISPDIFPSIIRQLTKTEIKPGGPYNTWIVSNIYSPPWHDIDVVVNSTIGYFLKLHNIHLPELQTLAEQKILKKQFITRYYYSFPMTLYCISRFYTGAATPQAIKYLLSQQHTDGSWGNPLDTSLCLSALYNFGYTGTQTKKALTYLIRYATKNIWESFPLYIEESHDTPLYAGASTLTAAFIYEALSHVETFFEKNNSVINTKKEQDARMKESIIIEVKNVFAHRSKTTQTLISKSIDAIVAFDVSSEVFLLAHKTLQAYTAKITPKQQTTSKTLGIANTLGWIAYTLYDDVLDDEADPSVITVANSALRELTMIYTQILSPAHLSLFKKIMNNLEEANYFERRNCRIKKECQSITKEQLPDYKKYTILAQKSFGHALSSLSILLDLGYSPQGTEYRHLHLFFKHYLIARQLNDDAHDWQEDLVRGFYNPVSVQILRDYFTQTNTQSLPYPYSKEDVTLQKIFWYTTITSTTKDIFSHIRKAKRAVQKSGALNPEYFLSLLEPIERAAKEALHEQAQMKAFLQAYK